MKDALGSFALSDEDRRHLAEVFRAGGPCFAQSLPFSAQAFLALGLQREGYHPVVWVADSARSLDCFYQDALALSDDREEGLACFPARGEGGGTPPQLDRVGDRLQTLRRCLHPDRSLLIATCIQALFQETPSPAGLERASRRLAVGESVEPADLVAYLEQQGYQFEPVALLKGQAARRGGILDVWPPTEDWPLRLEFFGDVLESIRTYDPAGQRSLEKRSVLDLVPAGEFAGPQNPAADLLAYLPPGALWLWSEPESIFHHAEMYRAILPEDSPARAAADFERFRLRVEHQFRGGQLFIGPEYRSTGPARDLGLKPCAGLPGLEGEGAFRPDLLDEARRRFLDELAGRARRGESVVFFFDTEGSRERFLEMHGRTAGFEVRLGALSEGFEVPAARLVVVAESDLYGFRKHGPGRYELHGRRRGARGDAGTRVAEWMELQPGELVVHLDHGIGKYLGLYEIEFDGRQQEVLAIEYAGSAKLYVPVSQTHLLSRYVGVGRRRPDLHALGGKRWTREKTDAERGVRDLAAAMIETQARRDLLDGHVFPPDTPWQHEFEAAFPFRETPDQHRAILDVKGDMESRRPMDRLVCGDVGYGKTEVAMRAAFKCVQDGRQVAVLVPTTILAQQHYDTFGERMAAYPVAVEMLSRFRTRAAQKEVVRRLAEGCVDVVIGTHRLLQPDVRFKDLGLVIIDEEQRFGVAHKEHFKHLRELVDVLTLTATPIPRTLYLSLTGARDMSTIQTPPQDRLPVETIVTQDSDEIMRAAILRELNRGGQVFYLHNRVTTIELVRRRLQERVPEARIEVGHGQMHEKDLAAVMLRFVRGEFDVLLCTTIIESGVDIPNVNTILIDRADRFGMADLYQLRGRVGRYKHQAYAYFLLPRHGRLFDSARRRIGAIRRYSSLGAGFKLALRDLEIRGAGNLLGAQQSGHISAVGFDLYCQLLKRTVARLKGEPVPPIIDVMLKLEFLDLSLNPEREDRSAVLPSLYIEDENLRVGLYRKLASAGTEAEVDALAVELRDRFGPLPAPADRLLKVARLRIVAAERGLRSIEMRENKVMMMRGADYVMPNGRFPRLKTRSSSEQLEELLGLIASVAAAGGN
ncbi:MAG: transcription-repair coupling factor [Verrucomicrobia bacterium]|nr:transcription-repair coupling factor [Verrucomicrobiota bacterium]